MELSCYISSHGFGHATRMVALLESLATRIPGIKVNIISTVPPFLFDSQPWLLQHYPVLTDLGFCQSDSFTIDYPATDQALETLLPYSEELINQCCEISKQSKLIVCDISPMGVVVGKRLGIPSVLLENFTWDWLYHQNEFSGPGFTRAARYFAELYGRADYHIQTEPVCNPRNPDLRCGPIARRTQKSPEEINQLLGSGKRDIVLITMGGLTSEFGPLERLAEQNDYFFVLTGQQSSRKFAPNITLLDHRTPFHHPDLINSSSLVICKAGYSTIAECSRSHTPVCCICRSDFSESPVLEEFVVNRLGGSLLSYEAFRSLGWLACLGHYCQPDKMNPPTDGGGETATFLTALL